MDPPPYLVLRVREQFFFQLVCIGSKKSPPISRVNKYQYNNNKRVRRESSLLEIAIGEGIRSAQLGKSSLRSEPGISIRLSSGTQSPENGYRRRGSLVHLAA